MSEYIKDLININSITFLFYKYLIILLSKLIPRIKFSISWFLLHGKKR